MKPVVTTGDPVSCGDKAGPGSPNVFVNGKPLVRQGIDKTIGHCFPPVPFLKGSPTVFVNGIPVVRAGDPIPVHKCGKKSHSGVATSTNPNVIAM